MRSARRSHFSHHFDRVALGRIEGEDRLYRGIKDRYAYVVIRSGSWDVWTRGHTCRVRPGDLLLKHPGDVYRDLRRNGPATFDVILIDEPAIDEARRELGCAEVIFDQPLLAAGDPRGQALRALHAALIAGEPAPAREQLIVAASAALVTAATGEPARRRDHERPAITRARAYLHERLTESITLDELADHVRLDKFHLIRAFHNQVGMPPYEYLTHLRIVRARELLRAGHRSTEVALALGYYDQSQFHRHFRRIVGTTPGAFARAHTFAPVRSSLRRSSRR